MCILDHLTCLLSNLNGRQEALVRTGHGMMDWFQIRKGVYQGCILSPSLFNLYAEYIIWNAGLDDSQAGIKIAGRNINNLRYADETILMAKRKEELKSLSIKVKEERGKSWLKTQHSKNKDRSIWSHHFMANRCGKVGRVTDFIFLVKITAYGDCSHEINRCFLLGKKAVRNLDSVLKSRAITLPTKLCIVKAMIFPVVMYGCECWTIGRLSTEELVLSNYDALESFMRVSWTAKRSNQSILKEFHESFMDCKEIQPVHPKRNQSWICIGRTDAEAEAPVLWPRDARSQLFGKDTDAGKDWGQEVKGAIGWDGRRDHRCSGHESEETQGDSEGQGSLACYSSWVAKSWTGLSDWITTITTSNYTFSYASGHFQSSSYLTLQWLTVLTFVYLTFFPSEENMLLFFWTYSYAHLCYRDFLTCCLEYIPLILYSTAKCRFLGEAFLDLLTRADLRSLS